MLPAVGPTPAAPSPSSFQIPKSGDTGFLAKLNVHQTPAPVSRVTVMNIPSSVSVKMSYVTEAGAELGEEISAPLVALARPR